MKNMIAYGSLKTYGLYNIKLSKKLKSRFLEIKLRSKKKKAISVIPLRVLGQLLQR